MSITEVRAFACPAKFILALQTNHMRTSSILLYQYSAWGTWTRGRKKNFSHIVLKITKVNTKWRRLWRIIPLFSTNFTSQRLAAFSHALFGVVSKVRTVFCWTLSYVKLINDIVLERNVGNKIHSFPIFFLVGLNKVCLLK